MGVLKCKEDMKGKEAIWLDKVHKVSGFRVGSFSCVANELLVWLRREYLNDESGTLTW